MGNVVTPVKNQGGCGSCWAFSAIESVESHYAIATGKLLTLAPQAYVDCVQNPSDCGGTGGCEGATMELAFNLTAEKGVPLETDLPYRGRDQKCPSYQAAVKVASYVKLPVNNADALETALATKGPISVTVAAGPWMLYGGGIFTGCSKSPFGSGADLDHGVQAVGYTKEYWIVRNSWVLIGERMVTFFFQGVQMTRPLSTSLLQMELPASHIQRLKQWVGSAESSSTPPIRQVQHQQRLRTLFLCEPFLDCPIGSILKYSG